MPSGPWYYWDGWSLHPSQDHVVSCWQGVHLAHLYTIWYLQDFPFKQKALPPPGIKQNAQVFHFLTQFQLAFLRVQQPIEPSQSVQNYLPIVNWILLEWSCLFLKHGEKPVWLEIFLKKLLELYTAQRAGIWIGNGDLLLQNVDIFEDLEISECSNRHSLSRLKSSSFVTVQSIRLCESNPYWTSLPLCRHSAFSGWVPVWIPQKLWEQEKLESRIPCPFIEGGTETIVFLNNRVLKL